MSPWDRQESGDMCGSNQWHGRRGSNSSLLVSWRGGWGAPSAGIFNFSFQLSAFVDCEILAANHVILQRFVQVDFRTE